MTIPVEIDFAELSRAVEANDAGARIIARSLRRACHVDGVFYLQLGQKGIKIEKFALEHARDFFSLPLEEKNKISNLQSAQYRGYIAHGKEHAGQPDFREQLEFGVEMPPARSGRRTHCGSDLLVKSVGQVSSTSGKTLRASWRSSKG